MALSGIPISEEQCIGDSLDVINNAFLALDEKTSVPVGSITLVAGNFNNPPEGFLVCDGSRKLKSQYTALYNWLTETGTNFPFGEDVAAADDINFKLPSYNTTPSLTAMFDGLVTVCIKT